MAQSGGLPSSAGGHGCWGVAKCDPKAWGLLLGVGSGGSGFGERRGFNGVGEAGIGVLGEFGVLGVGGFGGVWRWGFGGGYGT